MTLAGTAHLDATRDTINTLKTIGEGTERIGDG
jgi:hypothetical protein